MNDYESIAQMTRDFGTQDPAQWNPQDAAQWQCRILLAIAQQLSVIAGRLKPPEG